MVIINLGILGAEPLYSPVGNSGLVFKSQSGKNHFFITGTLFSLRIFCFCFCFLVVRYLWTEQTVLNECLKLGLEKFFIILWNHMFTSLSFPTLFFFLLYISGVIYPTVNSSFLLQLMLCPFCVMITGTKSINLFGI